MNNRRDFLKGATAAAVLADALSAHSAVQTRKAAPARTSSEDAAFTQYYDADRSLINLENAYWNIMARPVEAEYLRKVQYINRRNVPYVRSVMPHEQLADDLLKVRADVAKLVNVDVEEIALTRCGTESLQDLISGFNKLASGDTVLFADLDYDAMQNTMLFLRQRRDVTVATFNLPEPATTPAILAAYEDALHKYPQTTMMLVTHLCHRTGLVNPVKEIIALARKRGVTCILDTAQAVGQMPVDLRDINADFAGFSLHKWIGAPLGTGAIYIKNSRLDDIDLCLGNHEAPPHDIRSRIYPGTYNFAATLTIPAAIGFHNKLTVERKQARLQAMRNHWVNAVRDLDGLEILTPDDPARYGATTSFRLKNMKTFEQAKQVQDLLFDKYKVLTVARKGIAAGAAVRVTPGLYNTTAELDTLVTALKQEYKLFA